MKRKGFTLIELLAVIIILAIIAVIAIPTIINIITKARRSAFKDSVYGIIKAGEFYYSEKILNQEPIESDYEFIFPNDIKDLKIKGNKPSKGNMIVSKNGDIAVALSDGKYCVRKGYLDNDVTIDEDVDNCRIKEQANVILINDIKIEETEVKISPLETKKLSITITPSNATYKELEYTSSDNSVATVNNGTITGISNGNAVITVKTTDGTNIEKKINVSVITLVSDISLSATNITIMNQESITITSTILPSDATNQNLEWKSNNENIITVNNGLITGVSNGITEIIVKSTDGSNISKIINVTVKNSNLNINSDDKCIKYINNTCSNGTLVNVQVNDLENYNFYVIKDTGEELTLIMDRNLGGMVAWNADSINDNSKGPLTALEALETRTSDWSNIKSFTYTLTDDGGNKYNPITRTNVKARLLTRKEATNLGCTDSLGGSDNTASCPNYLYGNLSNARPKGYWTSSAQTFNSVGAWYVVYIGDLYGDYTQDEYNLGVRPVITISKVS